MADREDVLRAAVDAIAHDVKNPLNALSMHLALLERDIQRQIDTAALLNRVGTLRGQCILIDEMLCKFRQALHREVELKPMAIDRLLAEAVLEFEPSPKLHRDATSPVAVVDSSSLKTAIGEIWRNAIESADDRSDVWIATETDDDEIRIVITNHGSAPPDHLDIFKPFVTSRADHIGIGLTLARFLVRQQRGWISMDHQAGETRFRIHLQIAE